MRALESGGCGNATWGTKHIQPKTSVKVCKSGYWSEAVRTFRCLSRLSRRTMRTAHNSTYGDNPEPPIRYGHGGECRMRMLHPVGEMFKVMRYAWRRYAWRRYAW